MRPRRKSQVGRRGTCIGVMVVLLAVVNLAVVGVVTSSGDEADVSALRIEAVRARYAAESGAAIARGIAAQGRTLPPIGATLPMTYGEVELMGAPASGTSGQATVEGRSGRAARRLVFTLENP